MGTGIEKFNVDFQFDEFLSMRGINKSRITKKELIELEANFYAAFTQVFMLLSEGITKLEDEDKAVGIIDSIKVDLELYWANK